MSKTLSRQEIFDLAYRGLASQGWRRAMNPRNQNCSYRLEQDGVVLKCAVGWCIPDDKYHYEMDEFVYNPDDALVDAGFSLEKNVTYTFLNSLQTAHDQAGDDGKALQKSMKNFARNYRLEIPKDVEVPK